MPSDPLAQQHPLALDSMSDVPSLRPTINLSNFDAANADLQMTPQEQSLYRRHLENLTGHGGVDNPDGSRSTLFEITVELGDKTYVLPTVWNGKIVTPDEAVKLAQENGIESFPSYTNEDDAESRYQKMHDFMERDTAEFLASRKR